MADNYPKDTWKKKTVAETVKMYADWAPTYDVDIINSGYATPRRVAAALVGYVQDISAPVLDFGCGTGLSGEALKAVGFSDIEGVDISEEMLAQAHVRRCYRHLTQIKPHDFSFLHARKYSAVVAAGVISLGAAPANTLSKLVENIDKGTLLAFSYNDPTLLDSEYMEALEKIFSSQMAKQLFREKGEHLPGKGICSDVFVLTRL